MRHALMIVLVLVRLNRKMPLHVILEQKNMNDQPLNVVSSRRQFCNSHVVYNFYRQSFTR